MVSKVSVHVLVRKERFKQTKRGFKKFENCPQPVISTIKCPERWILWDVCENTIQVNNFGLIDTDGLKAFPSKTDFIMR